MGGTASGAAVGEAVACDSGAAVVAGTGSGMALGVVIINGRAIRMSADMATAAIRIVKRGSGCFWTGFMKDIIVGFIVL